jgi:hypothetical protein
MEFGPDPFSSLLNGGKTSPGITVDRQAERMQDQGNPCRMSAVMRQAGERRRQSDSDITKEGARTALETIDPQMVIESLLSREWGNRDEHTLWRQGRWRLKNDYERLLESITAENLPEAEAVAYKGVSLDGHPDLTHAVPEMIRRMQEFTAAESTMQSGFSALAAWMNSPSSPDPPAQDELAREITRLIPAIRTIAGLTVVGQPSPDTGLNPKMRAGHIRLQALVDGPLSAVMDALAASSQEGVRRASRSVEQMREAVMLARRYCGAQRRALWNTLSRGYQKPDFCIRRGSVGPHCGRFFPLTLSWGHDWYVGPRIEPDAVKTD